MTSKELRKMVDRLVQEISKSDLDVTFIFALNVHEGKKKDLSAVGILGDTRIMHHLLDEIHDGLHEADKVIEAREVLKELHKEKKHEKLAN